MKLAKVIEPVVTPDTLVRTYKFPGKLVIIEKFCEVDVNTTTTGQIFNVYLNWYYPVKFKYPPSVTAVINDIEDKSSYLHVIGIVRNTMMLNKIALQRDNPINGGKAWIAFQIIGIEE